MNVKLLQRQARKRMLRKAAFFPECCLHHAGLIRRIEYVDQEPVSMELIKAAKLQFEERRKSLGSREIKATITIVTKGGKHRWYVDYPTGEVRFDSEHSVSKSATRRAEKSKFNIV